MPRNGSGVYAKPGGSTAIPNTSINSTAYNATIDDIVADLNAARPVSSGGTGASTATAARTSLDLYSKGEIDAKIAGFSIPRNRIFNSGMQVSQERGSAFVDVTAGAIYAVDGCRAVLSTAAPGGTLRAQQMAGFTPSGSPNFLRFSVQAPDTSLAANDYYGFDFPIEGVDVADARFGTASAVPQIKRFAIRSSVAGTFHYFRQNGPRSRARVFPLTIDASEVSAWVIRTFVILPDTTGTWATDNSLGTISGITLAAGSSFNGTAGGWLGSDVRSVAGATNFMATAGATFDVSEVGNYIDPKNIGVAPTWELPDFYEELRQSQQHWWRGGAAAEYRGDCTNGIAYAVAVPIPSMRALPTCSVTVDLSSGFATPSVTGVSNSSARVEALCNSTGPGRFYIATLTANARF